MRVYAGIGSRETPENVLKIMESLGYILAKKGFVLRSGGADGADTAFESGCDRGGGSKEIYLPWKSFNKNQSNLYSICEKSIEIAWQYHPNFYKLSDGAQKLMARNGYQALGKNLKTPSEFIICYCEVKEDKFIGGTGQCLRIAQSKKIKVFNLFFKEQLEEVKAHIKSLDI